MTMFAVLDAVRVCERRSAVSADPSVWVVAAPPTRVAAPERPRPAYSWWSLARNPHAALVSALVGVAWAGDAALRRLA